MMVVVGVVVIFLTPPQGKHDQTNVAERNTQIPGNDFRLDCASKSSYFVDSSSLATLRGGPCGGQSRRTAWCGGGIRGTQKAYIFGALLRDP